MTSSSFVRFWTASAASSFGTAVTLVALPVLTVQVLEATPVEVGIVGAAQFLPYALLGLLAGAYVDRSPRRPVLVAASIGRAVALGLIPVLWAAGILGIPTLVLLLLLYGACAVFGLAASQSLLPAIVPRARLVTANARLDQADAAAQTAGPVLGGGLVGLVGAPLAIVADAVSHLVEAMLVATMRVTESVRRSERRHLGREIVEGLRWTYRHGTLAPLALSTHIWFLANAAALTTLSLFALRELGLSAVAYGMLLAAAGLAMLAGAGLAPWAGRTLGEGRTIVVARVVYPIAWAGVLVAVVSPSAAVPLVAAALVLQGFVAGLENANEMALRQSVAPDAALGRINATVRSVNRSVAALGAILAGVVVTAFGIGPSIAGIVAVFAVAAAVAVTSPLRAWRGDG